MRSAFFWDFAQRGMVFSYRRFGQPIIPIFKDKAAQVECILLGLKRILNFLCYFNTPEMFLISYS
jgi:hypothetical protein